MLISRFLANTALGQLRQFGSLGLVPLFNWFDRGPDCLSLNEALIQGKVSVTETNHELMGPMLLVRNSGPKPVLLLAGEELRNLTRALFPKRTILLSKATKFGIPACSVSSTSTCLHLSEAANPRATQPPRPGESLSGEQTSLQAFQPCPGQRGVMVTIGSEIIGLELLPNERTYKELHQKLLAKWAARACVRARAFGDGEFHEKAMALFRTVADCREKNCASIDGGADLEFQGHSVCGVAHVLGNQVIHLRIYRELLTERMLDLPAPVGSRSDPFCITQTARRVQRFDLKAILLRPSTNSSLICGSTQGRLASN